MARVGVEERVSLWRHDGMRADWQTVDSEFLRNVFTRGTDVAFAFSALVEYYATYPRKAVAELPEGQHECGICREALSDSNQAAPAERPMALPCGHIFGERCFAQWLSMFQGMSHTCPICRGEFWYGLDLSSLLRHGYDSPNLLKLTGTSQVNAAPEDAYGNLMQLWDRMLVLLKTINSLSEDFEAWVNSQPEARREKLHDHLDRILIHVIRPFKPDESGRSRLLDEDEETLIITDATDHLEFVDGGLLEEVIES